MVYAINERNLGNSWAMSGEFDIETWNPTSEDLRESKEQLEDAIESISDAFVPYDSDGSLVLCN